MKDVTPVNPLICISISKSKSNTDSGFNKLWNQLRRRNYSIQNGDSNWQVSTESSGNSFTIHEYTKKLWAVNAVNFDKFVLIKLINFDILTKPDTDFWFIYINPDLDITFPARQYYWWKSCQIWESWNISYSDLLNLEVLRRSIIYVRDLTSLSLMNISNPFAQKILMVK